MLAEGRYRYFIDSLLCNRGKKRRFCVYFKLCGVFFPQVLEAIGPPYSSEFVHLFMPMVENDEITGTMRGDGENDPVSEFIGNCFCFVLLIFTYFFFQFTVRQTTLQCKMVRLKEDCNQVVLDGFFIPDFKIHDIV